MKIYTHHLPVSAVHSSCGMRLRYWIRWQYLYINICKFFVWV